MSRDKHDTDEHTRKTGAEEAPVRHKGDDQRTTEEKKSGLQPDGNGGTNRPAAFPEHN